MGSVMKCFWLFLLLSIVFCTGVSAANRFAVCTTTCTWDNSSTAMWSTSSGGATGASVPTASDVATFDASTCVGGTTCTTTVNASLTIGSLVMGACTASTTGCILDFSVNNNNVAITPSTAGATTALNISGTGTRTLKMGSGSWTIAQQTGTILNATSITNLTFNAGSSTIIINPAFGVGTTVSWIGNTLTYNNLTINGGNNSGTLSMLGTPFYNTVTINGPNYIDFNGGGISTINNLIINGTFTNVVSIYFGQLNVVNLPITATFVYLRGTTCTSSSMIFANSLSGGENTLCTFSAPSLGAGACILGGWLLWRDMPGNLNDNFPAWLDKAA